MVRDRLQAIDVLGTRNTHDALRDVDAIGHRIEARGHARVRIDLQLGVLVGRVDSDRKPRSPVRHQRARRPALRPRCGHVEDPALGDRIVAAARAGLDRDAAGVVVDDYERAPEVGGKDEALFGGDCQCAGGAEGEQGGEQKLLHVD
jgi:hypothetical protein